ncbi:hypothetical protein DCAR_0100601 [Daucus carota subsp. sativus]|uniref:Uncharacterized protein n=1 Tax=Daucus carota subsp. sativus TaxID=79200 RepID=A0AAF0W195_DAUCS|nr:hypothetical protein DCAR_0100601 [Daucus carota subsp. sativus]
MEGGILVVSAPDEPMPQTKEHILLAPVYRLNLMLLYGSLSKLRTLHTLSSINLILSLLLLLALKFEQIQDVILFDNILIANDEKVAESYRQTVWKPKFDVEKEKQKAEEETSSLSDSLKGFQVSVKPAKEEVTEASNNGEDSSEEKERNEDTTAAPRRRTRLED